MKVRFIKKNLVELGRFRFRAVAVRCAMSRIQPPPRQASSLPAPSIDNETPTPPVQCVQASGAGDGVVRLWRLADTKGGSSRALEPLGGLAVRGFVNSLALGRSGRVLVAGVGQEPRMGRWLRDAAARNGVLIQPLQLAEEAEEADK